MVAMIRAELVLVSNIKPCQDIASTTVRPARAGKGETKLGLEM